MLRHWFLFFNFQKYESSEIVIWATDPTKSNLVNLVNLVKFARSEFRDTENGSVRMDGNC